MMIDAPQWGETGYALRHLITDAHLDNASVYWTMHGHLRSLQWRRSRSVLKVRDGFAHHLDPDSFRELLRESAYYGAPRPGSYSAIWWSAKDRPRVPTIRTTHRRYGLMQVAGAWQRAFVTGRLTGNWVHYDIRSAYLWALSLGLPDSTTYRWWSPTTLKDMTCRRSLFLCEFRAWGHAPYPYCHEGNHLATADEMDLYKISPRQCYGAIRWSGSEFDFDTGPITDSIYRYSCWKAIARSWWGMLATRKGVIAHYSDGTSRELGNYTANPVWAHLILGRVRARLWEIAQSAGPGNIARVYCDSVIVRDSVPVPIGDRVGDWREESRHADGGIAINSAVHVMKEAIK